MKRIICAFALVMAATPVAAQNSQQAFQDLVFETAADGASDARIPILCSGLYDALRRASGGDFVIDVDLRERARVARDISIVIHMLDEVANGVELEDATRFVDDQTAEVAAVFFDWFDHNALSFQNPFAGPVDENFRCCEGYYVDWTTTPDGN